MEAAMDEFDEEIDGIPHFLQIPTDWIADYGRLVVLGGRIEFAAYAIAGTLGVARSRTGRTGSFSATCKSITRSLDNPPPIARIDPGWVDRVRAWAETAPGLMDRHRNYHFHALTLMRSDGERWFPSRVERHDDFDSIRPLERSELRTAIRELRAVDKEGMDLWSVAPPLFLVAPVIQERVDLGELYGI